jgi:EAL domain-containing protein (putative c-di-GMP-specific phosphodiesterase class I)
MPIMESSNRFLRELRALGHLSALDDFGTGHNGMSLLTDYDFDVVKVDRSLLTNLLTSSERQRSINLLVQLLDVLGKRHVVEGIENEEVHRYLVDAGFTTFQGFLFHRPEPVAQLLAEASMGVER